MTVAAVHTGLCWLGVAAAQLTCTIKSIFGGEIETSQLDNQIDKLNLILCMYCIMCWIIYFNQFNIVLIPDRFVNETGLTKFLLNSMSI